MDRSSPMAKTYRGIVLLVIVLVPEFSLFLPRWFGLLK